MRNRKSNWLAAPEERVYYMLTSSSKGDVVTARRITGRKYYRLPDVVSEYFKESYTGLGPATPDKMLDITVGHSILETPC